MLDKTTQADVTEKDLGVGIRFACTVGNGRQIEMTAGIPLDWESPKINGILDKLASAMDRQSLRYQLHDMKQLLEQTERQLMTNRQQLANYEQKCLTEWEIGGRKGEWRATESQRKQSDNFKNNATHLAEQITKIRADIKDVEARCR